ncbi:glycosyltransferase family 4 protein [Ectobacillus antri]|uniref:Glycosyltransferase family 4 protein n=1 Tax=Ectobacillus antri TaxID=2486280 RepID=A0ABT6H830_9BACI|nr:glycosyltransferase family 4 protein [Ectobacillus antri]MDG4658484.1 glycosyltransferase family 4 protein [Ectobacillus antri]MDG5755490.1 glycosyltransferase family 4 protein [Ectobacillus antri]
MRVLHLNSGLLFGGGLERIIVDLMLKNRATENYLCIINNQWDEKCLEGIDRERILLCNRKIGGKNPILTLSIIYKIYKFIKRNNINIIHCHNSFALKFGYVLKRIIGVKVILTVHDTNAYYKELNRYPVDKYIAISKSVYNIISEYVSTQKIGLIYNGVDLGHYSNQIKDLDKKKTRVNISCVARIMPEKKGQDILIKALNVLKTKYNYNEFKCTFAGAIHDPKSMDHLNELIRKLNLKDNIEFVGNVENIEKVYGDTDIFVLPSRYEGFGLVVVEALASGCSVIVSKLDGPLEIIKEDEEHGLHFEKENYKELAYKLNKLINDPIYYNQYKNNKKTQEYLKREYSLENMIERYNKVYRAL